MIQPLFELLMKHITRIMREYKGTIPLEVELNEAVVM